jgi:Zn-dependent protease with chaperone function
MVVREEEMPAVVRRVWIFTAFSLFTTCFPTFAQRSQLKAPWNMYSPQTDIAEGRKFASQVEQQSPLCNDPKVDAYLTQLGKKLVAQLNTNGVEYPWEFRCVNDRSINAFALPGGFVFINRGAIEVADNESQLAGVMAHELSHVALRHGTAQASKASFAQGAAGIFGSIFGGSTGGALLTQGVSLGAGSALLHYSRSAETQADVMGTQVLYDSGYDPRAMAQFFEKLAQESKGKNPPEFFSDHPNPDHRLERVDEEVQKLGGTPPNARRDSPEFEAAKREVMTLPVPPKKTKAGTAPFPAANAPAGPPAVPSEQMTAYQSRGFSLSYPDNWKQFGGDNTGVTFVPEGGVVNDGSGHGALAYGLTIGTVPAQGNSNDTHSLPSATQQVINSLQQSNPNMKIYRQPQAVKLNNQPALSTYVSNDSPGGGAETDWLITIMRPEGLVYFVCTVPQDDFQNYHKTFAAILDSVRFHN